MTEEQTKLRKGSCVYRVHSPLIVGGLYIPAGAVADLSDVADVMLRWLLERKMIETTDPTQDEPVINEPQGTVKRKPCPCGR